MKSKTTWLLVLVLGIWGTIAYRIITGGSSDEVTGRPRLLRVAGVEPERKEDYPLMLDYTDPFLKKTLERKNDSKKPERTEVRNKPPEQVSNIIIQWENIEYLGAIFNTTRKITLGSIRIEGTDHMAREGEMAGGFRIEKITRDSIQLSYGSQTKFITRKK